MISRLLIFLIRCYQRFLSPLLGKNCRFVPTCSQYAIEAIRIHGPAKGLVLAVWRILRCNPFGKCGRDPVPPRGNGTTELRLLCSDAGAACLARRCHLRPARGRYH